MARISWSGLRKPRASQLQRCSGDGHGPGWHGTLQNLPVAAHRERRQSTAGARHIVAHDPSDAACILPTAVNVLACCELEVFSV